MKATAPLTLLGREVAQWRREMDQEGSLSPRTVEKYAANVERFATICEARGIASWDAADRSAVLAYISDAEPMPATKRNRLLSVRAFYRWRGSSDPSQGIRPARIGESLPDSLTHAEVIAMLDACRRDSSWYGTRDLALLELAYSTGARASELSGLTLAGIRLADRSARLRGKGNRERTAYLTESCVLALTAWLETRAGLVPNSEPHLFVSQALTRFSAMGLWKLVVKRAQQAGISRRVHPHMLRHSFATHLVRGGADLRAVQQLMGHRSIATTQVYLKADDAWTREVHARCHPSTEGKRSASDQAVRGRGVRASEGRT